jgi:signal transduction histidine kinase
MTNSLYPRDLPIQALLDAAYAMRVHDLAGSIDLAERALAKSEAMRDISNIAKSMSQLALFLMIKGDYQQSMEMSEAAISIFEETGDEKGLADAKYNVASVYYKTDDYHLGLGYLLDCLNVYKRLNDYHNQSKVEKSLGTVYEYFGDRKNALKSYKNAVAAAKRANDLNAESNCYNPLSGILLKEGRPEQAMKVILRSIELKQKTGDYRGLAFALYGRGKVHTYNNDFDKAEADFLHSIEIHLESGEKLGLGMAYNKMGALYARWGKPKKAITVLKKALSFSEKHKNAMIKYKSNKLLYEIYKAQGNLELSLKYLEKYQKEKENVINSQTLRVIENYEVLSRVKSIEKEAQIQKEKAEILEKKNRAEEAARIKQEFLSTMSHEIRTPLNALITISGLLENRSSPEEQELIESLRFSGNNLMRIVNDILDFTKLDSGKMALDMHPEDLNALLKNILNTYKGLADEKGLMLDLQLDNNLYSHYKLDGSRLTQILGNLVSNAIKFTDRGYVRLHARIAEEHNTQHTILFQVEDTGEGIASSDLESIFESFSQPRSVTTRKHGGTGLGLAIVKKLVELHGGVIAVNSTPGKGSTFSFSISLRPELAEVQAPNSTKIFFAHKRALIAEDNNINALVLGHLLNGWGIEFDHANNGAEAIHFARINEYDIILMDIHMPEINGYIATKEIKTKAGYNKNTPVFALTADITADQDDNFRNYFSGFLLKPIEVQRLQECLQSLTERKITS